MWVGTTIGRCRGAGSAVWSLLILCLALSPAAAQVQSGDCNASCNALVGKDPLGQIMTGQSVTFSYFVTNRSQEQPIEVAPIIGPVSAELRCQDATGDPDNILPGVLGPGEPGTCCARLACVAGFDCVSPALSFFQIAGTFSGTTCNPTDPGITSCDVIDDNTVCVQGAIDFDPEMGKEVFGVSAVAENFVAGDGAFTTSFRSQEALLVDVTIDPNCPLSVGENEFGECATSEEFLFPAVCEVQMDKQISCDGGTTWFDVSGLGDPADDPNGDGNFDDPDRTDSISCTALPADLIQARYVASNAGDVELLDCSISEANTGITNAPIDIGFVGVGGTTPGVIEDDADQVCQDISGQPPEPAEATITCTCDPATLPNAPPATDTDIATFTCTDCDPMPATPGWGNPLLAAGLLLGLFWGWRRFAPAR